MAVELICKHRGDSPCYLFMKPMPYHAFPLAGLAVALICLG